jgi:hypothetical protein
VHRALWAAATVVHRDVVAAKQRRSHLAGYAESRDDGRQQQAEKRSAKHVKY